MAESTRFELRCTECGELYAEGRKRFVCDKCSVEQIAGGTTRGVLELVYSDTPSGWPDANMASFEFLSAFLPIEEETHLPPVPVGETPLVSVPRLGEIVGVHDLWIKDDTRNPSGSTKDRASQLVAAKAKQFGVDTIATASSGNAATALAAVCASSGQRAICFVPEAAPAAKLVQIANYGATLVPVRGTYDDAFDLCLAGCEEFDWYNRNTAMNPYTIEGKKTAAIEIAFQLQPVVPDVVIVPVGDGAIIAGVAKGFEDLHRAGLTDRSPRLIAAQPERSAALVNALQGNGELVPVTGDSVADSLNVQVPRNFVHALKRVKATGGTGALASNEEIVEAIYLMASTTGIFPEPAAATSLAGLRSAVARGDVGADETVVLLVTGTGLKDIPAAASAVDMPEPIEPRLEDVAERLGLA